MEGNPWTVPDGLSDVYMGMGQQTINDLSFLPMHTSNDNINSNNAASCFPLGSGAGHFMNPNSFTPVNDPAAYASYDNSEAEDSDSSDLSDSSGTKKTRSVNRWSKQEHALLEQLVQQYGTERKWTTIASLIPGRTGKQCRERWLNHLRPDIKRGSWTPAEEYQIAKQHSHISSQWSRIARSLPGRTENNIKNHWNALFRSKGLLNRTTGVLAEYMKLLKAGVPPQDAFAGAVLCVQQQQAQQQLDGGSNTGRVKEPRRKASFKRTMKQQDTASGVPTITRNDGLDSMQASGSHEDSCFIKLEIDAGQSSLTYPRETEMEAPCHVGDLVEQMASTGEGALSWLRSRRPVQPSSFGEHPLSQLCCDDNLGCPAMTTEMERIYQDSLIDLNLLPWDAADMLDESEVANALAEQYGPDFASITHKMATDSVDMASSSERLQNSSMNNIGDRLPPERSKSGSLPSAFWDCASSIEQRSTDMFASFWRFWQGSNPRQTHASRWHQSNVSPEVPCPSACALSHGRAADVPQPYAGFTPHPGTSGAPSLQYGLRPSANIGHSASMIGKSSFAPRSSSECYMRGQSSCTGPVDPPWSRFSSQESKSGPEPYRGNPANELTSQSFHSKQLRPQHERVWNSTF